MTDNREAGTPSTEYFTLKRAAKTFEDLVFLIGVCDNDKIVECLKALAEKYHNAHDRAVNTYSDVVEALRAYVEFIHHPFTTPFNRERAIEHWKSEHKEGNGEAIYHLNALDALSKAEMGAGANEGEAE